MRRLKNLTLLRRTKRHEESEKASSLEPYVMANPALDQTQSLFFQLLSKDVRLIIHEAVLTDPRLLHIVPYRGTRKKSSMGNWRCNDEASPSPTWQHSCFGDWADADGLHKRREPRSNGNLVSWLLACRLVYMEAIDVLYNTNVFSFSGAAGVLCFRAQMSTHNWDRLRRLNISTVFRVPMDKSPALKCIPPENYTDWKEACAAIATLGLLQLVTIDMVIWNWYDRIRKTNTGFVGPESFIAILQPLKAIKAREMEVELNVQVPESIKEMLEPIDYRIVQRNRQYNFHVFPHC